MVAQRTVEIISRFRRSSVLFAAGLCLLLPRSGHAEGSGDSVKGRGSQGQLFKPGPPGPASNPNHFQPMERKRMKDMVFLDHLLSLPPDRLSHMRKTISRIEEMSPEEKEGLRNKINEFKKLNPNQRIQLEQRWNRIPSETRMMLQQHYWQNMSPEERRAERRKLQEMSPEGRRKHIQELAEKLKRRGDEGHKNKPGESSSEDDPSDTP